MIHIGRAIANSITIALVALLYFDIFDISNFSFLQNGAINFALPISSIIIFAILVSILIFDFAVFGGPWTPIYPIIFVTLIFQNWAIGGVIATINAVLVFTVGKIGGGF
jgi:hypothetical protein